MKHKLKYINLFEELSQSEIPYSEFDDNGKLNIRFPKSVTSVPPVFNELTTEVTGDLSIFGNTYLHTVTGFNQLQSVGETLSIWENIALETVTGFNHLQSVGDNLWIGCNTALQSVKGFNQLQSVGRDLSIYGNTALQNVTGFEQLQSVGGWLSIGNNKVLQSVTGFNQLQSVRVWLSIGENPNLVTLSIPSTIIRSVNYKNWYIRFEEKHKFNSPESFVNFDVVIQDCIDKFNPGLHGDTVIKQIVENVELWGTDETKETIYNHIVQNGKPEHIEHLPEMYRYLYHPKHKNTGAKSVAKVATGITYGLF